MGALEQIGHAYEEYRKQLVIQVLAAKGPSNFVPGEGPPDAPLMLVGEAPGETENEERRPFVGKSGQLLRRLLAEAGIDPAACYITNIVKFRPPRNRTPYVYELQASRPCLLAEVLAVRPMVIATLGVPALSGGFGISPEILGRQHGRRIRWSTSDGEFACDLVPLYHPSYILRTGNEDLMLADLKAI